MKRKPCGYWTYERCKEEVSKYNTKKELYEGNGSLYITICKKGWHHLTSELELSSNNILQRLIYVYEFSDNHCYIGLTYNIKDRNNSHLKKGRSQVYKHIIKTGLAPKLVIKTDKLYIKEAVKMEEIVLKQYINNGWIVLNLAKTGSTGGFSKFNIENCIKNIKKCKSIKEFRNKYKAEYNYIIKHNLNKDNEIIILLFNNMRKNKLKKYSNKEACRLEASLYKNRLKFNIGSPTAYKCARINGWLDEFFKIKIFNDKEECRSKSMECKTRSDFFKKYRTAYGYAKTNGWLDEFYPKSKKITY